MKEHGDNGSTTTARGLPASPHLSSSDKLLRDQELQHLVTSSIPSPPYAGLSLINASAALVLDPIYSSHLFASLAANPTARFQLPIPMPLTLQPTPASHPAHQNPLHHHHHQRNLFHHLPTAAVPAFATLPGAALPNVTQLDILSTWVNEQASRTAAAAAATMTATDDRKITSTTSITPPNPSAVAPNNRRNSGNGSNNKNNRRNGNNNSQQVKSKNSKNLMSGNGIKLSKRANANNGRAELSMAKTNRRSKVGRNNLLSGIVSSSENDMIVKKEEFEKDVEPMNFGDAIIQPFLVETSPVGKIEKMEIDHHQSPSVSIKGGKAIVVKHGDGSPTATKGHPNNNNNNSSNHHDHNSKKSQGQTSPGQNGTRDKVFTCPTCNRCFGYKHVLQNHERTHTGEKPFECNICSKKFTRDHHLKTHMRLHTGEKPYQCTYCDRQFVQVANLRRHVRVHTGERPYNCDICSTKFSDSNQLKAHMLIHKGEKPYSCAECGISYRRRHHLAHHKCSVKGGDDHHQQNKYDVHQPASSSSSSDTSPPQLLTPPSAAGSDKGEHDLMRSGGSSSVEKVANGKRERKCQKTRRIIRLDALPLSSTMAASGTEPEQDHPEDLSMSGSTLRSRHYSGSSSSVASSPSPRSGVLMAQLVRPYSNSSSEETPDLFTDEDLRAADSSTNGKNESSSDDISSQHE